MRNIEEQVIAKLSAEGLSILSPWEEIEACLSRTVSPTACIETARGLVDEVESNNGWGRSYLGISSKICGNVQLTVEDRGNFTEAYALNLTSTHPFTSFARKIFHGTNKASEAKEWLETLLPSYQ